MHVIENYLNCNCIELCANYRLRLHTCSYMNNLPNGNCSYLFRNIIVKTGNKCASYEGVFIGTSLLVLSGKLPLSSLSLVYFWYNFLQPVASYCTLSFSTNCPHMTSLFQVVSSISLWRCLLAWYTYLPNLMLLDIIEPPILTDQLYHSEISPSEMYTPFRVSLPSL